MRDRTQPGNKYMPNDLTSEQIIEACEVLLGGGCSTIGVGSAALLGMTFLEAEHVDEDTREKSRGDFDRALAAILRDTLEWERTGRAEYEAEIAAKMAARAAQSN